MDGQDIVKIFVEDFDDPSWNVLNYLGDSTPRFVAVDATHKLADVVSKEQGELLTLASYRERCFIGSDIEEWFGRLALCAANTGIEEMAETASHMFRRIYQADMVYKRIKNELNYGLVKGEYAVVLKQGSHGVFYRELGRQLQKEENPTLFELNLPNTQTVSGLDKFTNGLYDLYVQYVTKADLPTEFMGRSFSISLFYSIGETIFAGNMELVRKRHADGLVIDYKNKQMRGFGRPARRQPQVIIDETNNFGD